VCTRGSFSRGEAAGAWRWPLTCINCWGHEKWNYTFIPSHIFMAGTTLPSPLYIYEMCIFVFCLHFSLVLYWIIYLLYYCTLPSQNALHAIVRNAYGFSSSYVSWTCTHGKLLLVWLHCFISCNQVTLLSDTMMWMFAAQIIIMHDAPSELPGTALSCSDWTLHHPSCIFCCKGRDCFEGQRFALPNSIAFSMLRSFNFLTWFGFLNPRSSHTWHI
jgi:hypothetical protein